MNQIGEDGLSKFHQITIKNAKARGEIGYRISTQKMQQTKNIIGNDGLNIHQRTALKTAETRKNSFDEFGLSDYERAGVKARLTGQLRGIYKDYQTLTDFEKYSKQVDKFTTRSWKEFKEIIDPKNLKTLDSSGYHLDHVFSKSQGFKDKIPPFIVGHYTNLQILSGKDNISKGLRCWKTCKQLFEDYAAAANATAA